ncbi:PIN domain-containing protein [Granulicella arctica]|uniref:PIN domain-containing protein n=1 Tax=Granulicella arctica TaxID=940613 RepID=UPI0021E0994E|nr:PIN domain-containing protein [Granulicella arctica]
MNDEASGKVFLDTTILIYAISSDAERSPIAEALLAKGGNLSVQVLNEFVAVARRKLKMSWEETAEALASIRVLCEIPVPLTLTIHDAAVAIAQRYGYQISDATILAAALDSGCVVLYSKDMQHDQRIDSLIIRNPFAAKA